MRPVRKQESPRQGDFSNYRDAYPELRARLGPYCSYCERRIPVMLAVEHIQAKKYKDGSGAYPYAVLSGKWSNFLLACVNCNSTKGNKNVTLDDVFLPDRDNSFKAFIYLPDGSIAVDLSIGSRLALLAKASLELTGLNVMKRETYDSNNKLIALDRVQDRAEAYLMAMDSLQDWQDNPTVQLEQAIVRNALSIGFFSVWMTVFERYDNFKLAFVRGFEGTSLRCFDSKGNAVTPRSNDHNLLHGGKI